MRLLLTLLLSVTTLAVASAAPGNPAPMNGIWKLTGLHETAPGPAHLALPAGTLIVVNGQMHGSYGCGRFAGTVTAARNVVQVQVESLPPKPTERCLYAVRGASREDLSAAAQYTVSAHYLTVFSDTARLTFERIGLVTPANK